jgi:hypothetical protein
VKERIAEMLFGAVFGALITGTLMGFDRLAVSQSAYTEGREIVLNKLVTVGDETSPCAVQIPMSVLAEMVSAGVMRWHEICETERSPQ